ncbi:hypothetical protein [Streptomyces yaizuensis]|uniref:Uncharacterized protein n=1 Tax=Streptomyces yaizuensis TaxID=2989713 RepID=A0AA86JGB2_9ACTN|nr:hypothetical protein [Streptomyces sp. YSPA8]BDT39484.1 hypothetical protein SYYSPA8_36830 [Streptomyces sp. YSPA8]
MADTQPINHRARARDVRKRLAVAAGDSRLGLWPLTGEEAVTLVEAGVFARAANLARDAGALPAGLAGDAALGWRAAHEVIVAALRQAADHQGSRVSQDPHPPQPFPLLGQPQGIDWSARRTTPL